MNFLEPTNCLCFNLRKASRAVTQHYDRLLQQTGLRATQFTILTVLARKGAWPLTRLADHLVMDRTTLTRNLRPLTRQGFVKITAGDDQRIRMLSLTATGKKVLSKATPIWEKAQADMASRLGKAEFSRLLPALATTVKQFPKEQA